MPYGIAFDGEYIWTANSMDGTVTKLSVDGQTVGIYPVGASPAKILPLYGDIWITVTSDEAIIRLSP